MFIENAFVQEDGLISPDKMNPKIRDFPETVLLTFSEDMIHFLLQDYDVKEISDLKAGLRIPIYQFTCQGKSLGMYRTPLGGPAAAALMEEVIAKGARKILVFGSCGALQKGIDVGHILLPTAAYRDEGTSYHYLPASPFVDVPTWPALADILTSLQVPFMTGKTWTTDAFYRETPSRAAKMREAGCICVEMECASLMAVGQFRHIPVYQFLFGLDSLNGKNWDARVMGRTPKELKKSILNLALDVAVRLPE